MKDECREILTKIETYLDGETAPEIERTIATHVAECPPCMERADFERELRELLAKRCQCEAPTDLRDRIVSRLPAER